MTKNASAKVECRTPLPERTGTTNIPAWKYEAVSAAISNVLKEHQSVTFAELSTLVKNRLEKTDLDNLGSVTWHVTTVKLEMEVRGEIKRLKAKGSQKISLS